MTDVYRTDDPAADQAAHHALVGLHSLADGLGGVDPGTLPGFVPLVPAVALRTVAEAPVEQVPVSARVGVLYSLASKDFPHYEGNEDAYRALADSVAQQRTGVDADQLLSDVKAAAAGDTPFEKTASGQALPHHEAVFVDRDVCATRTVTVGGLRGTWVYSELETDAPFAQVADWVDPRSWPQRGPMMFKGMSVVGGNDPVRIGALGTEHWHGVFHEEVQLVRRMNTLLHCDFWRDGDQACGMTYDLALSLDNQLDVDRGFLLVVDTGATRRVKVLKIVGFTDDVWDDVARMVCPFWTDWVRGAVQGGSTSVPHPPKADPGSPDTPTTGGATGDRMSEWLEFFGDAARVYADLFDDVTGRAAAGGYSATDWLDDARRTWTQLAKDWARAWSYGMESLQELREQGLDAGFAPPGADREAARGYTANLLKAAGDAAASATAGSGAAAAAGRTVAAPAGATTASASARVEGTTVPLVGLGPNDQPRVTGLTSIEAGGSMIPESDLAVSVITTADGSSAVRVTTANATAAPGLYVGTVQTAEGQPLAPVQLYLSRAEAPAS
jgi:hypothetical protein